MTGKGPLNIKGRFSFCHNRVKNVLITAEKGPKKKILNYTK